MIRWLQRQKTSRPIYAEPGDTIVVMYENSVTGMEESTRHKITKADTFDTLAIGYVTDDLGFDAAYIGVIGRASNE